MIVLDTNVLSEVMRVGKAEPRVVTWLRTLPQRPVTTVVSRAELLLGVAILPAGRRREELRADATAVLDRFECVPMREKSADHFAEFVAERQRRGKRVEAADAFIAAICLEVGATLATRNTSDFEGVGLDLVNPWR